MGARHPGRRRCGDGRQNLTPEALVMQVAPAAERPDPYSVRTRPPARTLVGHFPDQNDQLRMNFTVQSLEAAVNPCPAPKSTSKDRPERSATR
jgi:hypothetical protein